MRIIIIGNSGSGKSTFARHVATTDQLTLLDLDSVMWEPHQIAVTRSDEAVRADLLSFVAAHLRWVIEGCYGDVAERLLPACSKLVFMNPGLDVCVANCLARPWQPEKYQSSIAQQHMLPHLLQWVRAYYNRDDSTSYSYHRRLFDDFTGEKIELTENQPAT
jgi:adenylate kinase family enzyme